VLPRALLLIAIVWKALLISTRVQVGSMHQYRMKVICLGLRRAAGVKLHAEHIEF
jgi:hypothetical protein